MCPVHQVLLACCIIRISRLPCEVVTFIIPIFQMRKLRYRRRAAFLKPCGDQAGGWDLDTHRSDILTQNLRLAPLCETHKGS